MEAQLQVNESKTGLDGLRSAYCQLLDLSLEGVFVVDPDGQIIDVNECGSRMVGYSSDELYGLPITELITPESLRDFPLQLQVFTTDRNAVFERNLRRKDGSIITAIVQGRRLSGGAYLAVLQDITEQKRTARALRLTQERYRELVEMANTGVWSMDAGHVTSYVNPKMAQMLGYTQSEMVGRTVESFMFEEDLDDHAGHMQKRHLGEKASYERRFRRKDGSVLWAQVAATADIDAAGNFAGSFGMFTDITAQKRAGSIQAARLHLMQYAIGSSLHDLLVETLDVITGLTGSSIGFYHFLEPDQKTIHLQAWSSRTSLEFCNAAVGSSRVDLQACKLEYSIVSPK